MPNYNVTEPKLVSCSSLILFDQNSDFRFTVKQSIYKQDTVNVWHFLSVNEFNDKLITYKKIFLKFVPDHEKQPQNTCIHVVFLMVKRHMGMFVSFFEPEVVQSSICHL